MAVGRTSRTASVIASLALVAAALTFGTGTATAVAPVTPAFGPTADGFADYDGQTLCSPTPKPGARKLAALLVRTYGPASIGITRACSQGGTSEHKEGRALDWMLSVRVPAQRAKVQAFLAWLLATDSNGNQAAMARRLGIMYIGWNNQMWRAYGTPGWGDLKGCSTTPAMKASSYDTTCHRNHVHLSLSWDGAAGLTSFWTGAPLASACQAPWSASSTLAGSGTGFVPVSPTRVLDTKKGVGLDQPCRLSTPPSWNTAQGDAVVRVTGVGDVPADGVAAVAVRLTAYRTSGILPTVYVRSLATSSAMPVVPVLSPSSYSGTAVVPVADDGTIRFYVDRGGADVLVDVVGYVPLPPPPDPNAVPAAAGSGTLHLTRPTLVYDAIATPLAAHEQRTVHLGGVGPIPASGLSGLALSIVSARTSAVEVVSVLPASLRGFAGAVRTLTTLGRVSHLVMATADGDVVLRNSGSVPAPVRLYVTAFTTLDPTDGGGALTSLAGSWRAIDTAAGVGINGAVTSGAARSASVVDGVHVPVGATGVLIDLRVRGGSSDGTVVVGGAYAVSAVSFLHGARAHEVLFVPLDPSGALSLRTASLGTQVAVVVLGYVR
jgi:hypothetical protein